MSPIQATVLDLTRQLSARSNATAAPGGNSAGHNRDGPAGPSGLEPHGGGTATGGSHGAGSAGNGRDGGRGQVAGRQAERPPDELRAVERRVEEQERTISQLCGEISK